MARTLIATQNAPGSYGVGVTGITLTEVAADLSNLNSAVLTGQEVIVAHNTGGSAATVVVTAVPDRYGRTTNIGPFSIPAGSVAIFGPFHQTGWLQSDGRIYFQASSTSIKFAVVSVPWRS
jgi:hypothetical protein